MVKQPHLLVLREANVILIGYVKLDAEDADSNHRKLNEFFNNKKLSLEEIQYNTGVTNGVWRSSELRKPYAIWL